MSNYTTRINAATASWNRTIDARHIEAYMRCENPTLDHLSADAFSAEVFDAIMCVDEGGVEMAEQVAASFGL